MRVDSIRLFRVPLAEDRAAPSELTPESILVRAASGSHVGWGEVLLARAPLERQEWSEAAFLCLRDWLAPALVGRSIESGDKLQQLLAPFDGQHAAKSALDTAWWMLAAAGRNQSLYEQLAGARTKIRSSCWLPPADSIDALVAQIRAALDAGHDHVTLKLRPGWDVEMLRAVRQALPAEPLAVDCDGLCTLGQQEMFYRLEDFFLQYIEQPLPPDDLVGHAMLQQNLRTPLALDQSVTSQARVEQAIDLGSCRLVRIDPARVGGITPALAIRGACETAQIATAVEGAARGGLAALVATALAGVFGASLAEQRERPAAPPWFLANPAPPTEGAADAAQGAWVRGGWRGWRYTIDEAAVAQAALDDATLG